MVGKLKKFLRTATISLAYGLKGAEDLFRRQKPINVDGTAIQQQVGVNELADAMLRGEVTQEVALLRDRLYYVAEEAKKLTVEIDSNGNIKTTKKNMLDLKIPNVFNEDDYIIKLVMENNNIPSSAIEVYQAIDGDISIEKEHYPLIFEYENNPPKYNLSKYISKIVIRIKGEDLKCDLYVPKHTDSPERLSMVFNTEIKRIMSGKLKHTSLEFNNLEFITNDAYGSDDLYRYKFEMSKFNKITPYKNYYVIQYDVNQIVKSDKLTDKYIKPELREKYAKKERKNNKLTADFSETLFKENKSLKK